MPPIASSFISTSAPPAERARRLARQGIRSIRSVGEGPLTILAFAVLAALLARMAILGWDGSYYAIDSFWYYDLSRTVFEDPYRLHTIGSFESRFDYGAPFPPGLPLLLAVGDSLLGTGLRTGLILNLALTLLAALLAERFFRHRFRAPGFGVLSVLALCAYPPFADQIVGGGPAPATLVLLLALLLLLPVSAASYRDMCLLGAVLGGLAAFRFDWLWPALLLPVLLSLVANRRVGPLLACYGSLLLLFAPWIVYSIVRLGVPFGGDGSFVGLSVFRREPTDYLGGDDTTLFEDPLAWVERIVGNIGFAVGVVRHGVGGAGPVVLLLLAGFAAAAILVRRRHRVPAHGAPAHGGPAGVEGATFWRQAGLVGAVLLAQVAFAPLVFRFGPVRYWALVIYVSMVALCLLFLLFGIDREPDRRRTAAVVATSLSVLGGGVLLVGNPLWRVDVQSSAGFDDNASARKLIVRCVGREQGVMVLAREPGDSRNKRFAAQLAAVTRQRSLFEPGNLERLTPALNRRLLTDFRVDYLFVPTGAAPRPRVQSLFRAADPSGRGLRADPCGRGLYRAPA